MKKKYMWFFLANKCSALLLGRRAFSTIQETLQDAENSKVLVKLLPKDKTLKELEDKGKYLTPTPEKDYSYELQIPSKGAFYIIEIEVK